MKKMNYIAAVLGAFMFAGPAQALSPAQMQEIMNNLTEQVSQLKKLSDKNKIVEKANFIVDKAATLPLIAPSKIADARAAIAIGNVGAIKISVENLFQ